MAQATDSLSPFTLNDYGFTEQEAFDLEALIDRHGIEEVLHQICDICEAKADHIRENWQDTVLAQRWATAAGAVGVASTKATGL
jgi:hypothetical protein